MNYYKHLLVNYWLSNIIKNKINNDILLFIFKRQGNLKINKKSDFKKDFNLDTSNYKVFDIDEINSLYEIMNSDLNTNVILLGHELMNIDKVVYNDCKILICPYHDFIDYNVNKKIVSNETIKNICDSASKPEIDFLERCEYYIESRDPFKIINIDNPLVIYQNIFSLLLQKCEFGEIIIFSHLEILQSNKITPFPLWKKFIEQDINILIKCKILTSRLAIAIYKATTLRLNDSNKRIGLFYYKQFEIKAKTVQLPTVKAIQRVKAYDLKKLEHF
jgi:hypothetical protein